MVILNFWNKSNTVPPTVYLPDASAGLLKHPFAGVISLLFVGLIEFENLPESKSLVSSSSRDCLSIRTQSHMQNTAGVSSQFRNTSERRIFPQTKLIVAVAVRRHKLSAAAVPQDATHLASGVHRVDALTGDSVPETQSFVQRPASADQQVGDGQIPDKRFHCRRVLSQLQMGT